MSAPSGASQLHDEKDPDELPIAAPLEPEACSTVEELRAAFKHLSAQEATISTHLQNLVSTQTDLAHTLSRLDLIRAHLGTQVVAARSLTNNVLSPAATTAHRVSSAVKRLDIEQSRVKATLGVVEQVAELKACVLGVTGSMGAPQDWETAASYLHRASKIPPEITSGEFAEEMVPSAEVPDMPSVTLENAAESLCGLFLREFERAAASNDGEKVTRFFKLFPLIGRAHVGLGVYGRYVCAGVASRARTALAAKEKGDFFYSTAMTRLFEHIATIVEEHGTLVDRHYGSGKMVKVVERLQIEADTQGGIIIDTFMDEKNIDRKLTEVKSYAFSFLVQSFLGGPRATNLTTGIQRTASPAPGSQPQDEDDAIDVKEIDLLLTEMGVMLGRWSLYCRFLARKCVPEVEEARSKESPSLQLPPVIINSNLLAKVHDRLVVPFTTLTTFFLRRSVEKAFQLDEAPSDLKLNHIPPTCTPPYISSSVDDVMYIVSKLLQRALETSQRSLCLSVISTASRVLSSDFLGMIQRKMAAYPRGSPPQDDRVLSFLILINNLDTAAEYNSRIISGFTDLPDLFPFKSEVDEIRDALANMESAFEAKTAEVINDAVTIIFNQVVKPKLRPILADAWRDVDYLATTSSEEAGEDEDLVKERFQVAWDALVNPLKRILSERTGSKLINLTATASARLLEKRIWACDKRVSELGAIRLERDVAGVVGVVVRMGRYGVRDVFARCSQICLVVNMEEEEFMADDGSIEWKLEREERERARKMVVSG